MLWVRQTQSGDKPARPVDERIADELGVAVRQVSAAVELLDGGATVPFIARYRKEATGTLDDTQLRTLEERLREAMAARGTLSSKVRAGAEDLGAKFADYFEFSEPFARLPAHRVLALFRGEKEEVLDLTFDPGQADEAYEAEIAGRFGVRDQGRPADAWLAGTVHWAWRTRILPHLSVDIRVRLWQAAEDEAVRVFAANVRDLLLAAPAGARPTIGLDPGFRTGVKVAVTDGTGKVTATATIYPHEPHRQWDKSLDALARLARQHRAELIAIGNGTASRETDRLAADLIRRHPELT